MKKSDVFLLSLFAVLFIIGIVFYQRSSRSLINHGVYVIGKKIKYIPGGGELSAIWDYEYYYKGNRYEWSFQSMGAKFMYSDSLIFLKISSENPKYCEHIMNVRVPYCLSPQKVPKDGWIELPLSLIHI